MRTYSYNVNTTSRLLCPSNSQEPITSRAALPIFIFGEDMKIAFTFPASTLEEGETLMIGVDTDMFSGGDYASMINEQHIVTAEEAANSTVEMTLHCNFASFLDKVNGIHGLIDCFFAGYVVHQDGSQDCLFDQYYIKAYARGVVVLPDDPRIVLPNTIYYNREQIDQIANTMNTQATAAGQAKDDAITAKTAAEQAKEDAIKIAEGTDEEVEPFGLEKSSKGHAEASAQSATAAGQAKNAAVTAEERSRIWAEGTDEEAEALGGEKSARGYARAVAQGVTDTQTLKDQTQALYESVLASIAEYHVGPVDNYGVTANGSLLSFTWRDPADNNVVKWKCSRLIYKIGGFPVNERDGVVLLDNYVRNAYQITPFTFDMLAMSNYYFAIFTQSTGGLWNTGDDAPRFTTDLLTWQTICMMTRAGTLLQYPGMAIGSVVDIQTNSLFPALRWKLAHIDYKGTYEHIEDYMLDNTRHHNSIWIPHRLPCLGDSQSAMMIQFDAPEKSYGQTWDSVFINGKAYYTASGETYTQLTAGTDYENGDSISDWQTTHGDTVYTKNHADRVSSGCNSWMMSNIRQGLNGKGANLYTPQNEYDVQSSHSFYITGFLAGFSEGYLDNIMPVRNKTARNTISSTSGGGGGGFDITLDKFWLPSIKEIFNTNSNSIAEGAQFDYFKNVATTNADRIQYDESMTARNTWARTANTSNTRYVNYINTSGTASSSSYASTTYAVLPAQCVA